MKEKTETFHKGLIETATMLNASSKQKTKVSSMLVFNTEDNVGEVTNTEHMVKHQCLNAT